MRLKPLREADGGGDPSGTPDRGGGVFTVYSQVKIPPLLERGNRHTVLIWVTCFNLVNQPNAKKANVPFATEPWEL